MTLQKCFPYCSHGYVICNKGNLLHKEQTLSFFLLYIHAQGSWGRQESQQVRYDLDVLAFQSSVPCTPPAEYLKGNESKCNEPISGVCTFRQSGPVKCSSLLFLQQKVRQKDFEICFWSRTLECHSLQLHSNPASNHLKEAIETQLSDLDLLWHQN